MRSTPYQASALSYRERVGGIFDGLGRRRLIVNRPPMLRVSATLFTEYPPEAVIKVGFLPLQRPEPP
jgi:hypothetical protein